MDFSVFDKRKKTLPTHCELIVIDFVNKQEVYRVKIDNLLPVPNEVETQFNSAVKLVSVTVHEVLAGNYSKDELLKKAE